MHNEKVDDQVKNFGIISNTARNEWKNKFKQKFDWEIKNLDQKVSSIIISSEHFHSRLTTQEEVNNLADFLSLYFDDVKIIVYLRRQDKLAVSFYSTMIRVGETRDNILPETISPDASYYNYYNLIERWANTFGKNNLNIRIFDKNQFINGSLLDDFIAATNIIKPDNFAIPEIKNQKLSASVQYALILMNSFFPKFVNNRPAKLNNQLRSYVIKGLEQKYQGKERLPTRQEALNFYENFATSNQKLADKYLSGGTLFSNDFSMYPESSQEESLHEEILRDIFGHISSFLNSSFVIPKSDIDVIDLDNDSGAILRDIAILYELDYPEIALFLMKEAQKYRSNGTLISRKIENIQSVLSNQ